MSRLDRFEDILKSYDGREYHAEPVSDDTWVWEGMKKMFDKEGKLSRLDGKSKPPVIQLYKAALDKSADTKDPKYVLGMTEAILHLLDQENYTNPHAVAVWYELNSKWLDEQ